MSCCCNRKTVSLKAHINHGGIKAREGCFKNILRVLTFRSDGSQAQMGATLWGHFQVLGFVWGKVSCFKLWSQQPTCQRGSGCTLSRWRPAPYWQAVWHWHLCDCGSSEMAQLLTVGDLTDTRTTSPCTEGLRDRTTPSRCQDPPACGAWTPFGCLAQLLSKLRCSPGSCPQPSFALAPSNQACNVGWGLLSTPTP